MVILAGGGARRADTGLRALAEALDAPLVQTVNARGLLAEHRLAVPASPSLQAVRDLIAVADQVLAIGTKLGPTDYDMYVRDGLPDLSGMIRVDICADQLARHPCAVALHGDAGTVCAALAVQVARRSGDGLARAVKAQEVARGELVTLHPDMPRQVAFLEALRDALPGALIVGDSTQPVYAGNLLYAHDRPGGWFNAATGYGALGLGNGAAVGAALAAPGVPVVCLVGDGGLMFSPGEVLTARDEGLNITFIAWNNAGFGEIADNMKAAGLPPLGHDPSPVGMTDFARACGLPYVKATPDPDALKAALMAPAKGPGLIEVAI